MAMERSIVTDPNHIKKVWQKPQLLAVAMGEARNTGVHGAADSGSHVFFNFSS